MSDRAAEGGRGPAEADRSGGAPGALARALVEAGGGSVRSIVLYGSHRLGLAREQSAVDLVAVVDSYRRFYTALAAAGELHRPVWLMSAAAHVLPPSVIAFAPEGERGHIAKVLVLDGTHLDRAVRPRPKDHFVLGRLIQDVEVLWAADDGARERVAAGIARSLGGVLTWAGPFLVGPFDAESLGRRLLEILYRGEVRPEAGDRAERVFEAQCEHFRTALAPVLERAAAAGTVVREGEGYRLARSPGLGARIGWRLHFARSKARATLRWFKHMVTFANWLPYVVQKVERHTGRPVELTRLERRWPVVFLWPRAIKVLLSQSSRREGPS